MSIALGREPGGRLVEEEQRGPADERAAERDELALAARERAGALAAAVAQEREQLDDARPPRRWRSRRASACAPTSRFSATVSVGKDVVELRDEAEAAPREAVGRDARHVVAAEGDGAARRADEPVDRLEERRLPGAVRADHRDDLVGAARAARRPEARDARRSPRGGRVTTSAASLMRAPRGTRRSRASSRRTSSGVPLHQDARPRSSRSPGRSPASRSRGRARRPGT